METINTVKRFAAILFTFTACTLYGQDFAATQTAFIESYALEQSGEYTKAANRLKQSYDANSYEINLRMGWLNYQGGLFSESVSNYKRSISLMPLSIEARLGIVYPLSALGKWEEIIVVYNDILKVDAYNYTANYRLGAIYYGKSDFQNAYKHLKTIVELYPFDYDATLLFGWTNFKIGKVREARLLFQKVLLYMPGDSSASEGLSATK